MVHKLRSSRLLPGTSEVMSFADPLKAMARVLLNPVSLTHENKENPEFGLCGKSPRQMLQSLGTEWGRNMVGENIWCEAMVRRIKMSPADFILIDDLRFLNEAHALKKLDAVIIRLAREGIEYTGEHESEIPLPADLIDLCMNVTCALHDFVAYLNRT